MKKVAILAACAIAALITASFGWSALSHLLFGAEATDTGVLILAVIIFGIFTLIAKKKDKL